MLFLKYLFLSSNVRFEIFKYTVILEEEKKINKISPRYVKYSQYDKGKGKKKKRINFNREKVERNNERDTRSWCMK